MYQETFFRKRIGHGYAVLMVLAPGTNTRPFKGVKSSRDHGEMGIRHPKRLQRAVFLQDLFEAKGREIGAMLRSCFVPAHELITTRLGTRENRVTYGIDHGGPFVERFEKRFLMPKKKLVRRRVSFEELVMVYRGEDPDQLVNDIRNFIAEAIGALEQALLERSLKADR